MTNARRHGTELSVMVLDLDGLRGINDSHGHAAGDEVLRTPLGSAARTAERVRMRIEAMRVAIGRKYVQITGSIGVAEIGEPGAQLTGAGLVCVAEKRLHRAKLLGKNRVSAE